MWVQLLWEQEQREYQYFGMTTLEYYSNLLTKEGVQFVLSLVVTKSWWDTVDFLASNVLGNYYLKHRGELGGAIRPWIESDNMWLNRTAIIVQLKHKAEVDLDILEVRENNTPCR